MHALSLPALQRLAPKVPVLLRLVIGGVMFLHGWSKLTQMGPANFGSGMLAGLGVPAPVAAGWLVTGIELVGGALILVGLATRIAAGLNAIVLAVATLLVKVDLGIIAEMGSPLPGAELDLALIAGALAIVVLGPGRPSLDHVLGIESTEPIVEATEVIDLREESSRPLTSTGA